MRALSLRLIVLALVVLAAAAELCTLTVSTSRLSRAKKNMAKLTFTVTNNRKKSVPNGAFEVRGLWGGTGWNWKVALIEQWRFLWADRDPACAVVQFVCILIPYSHAFFVRPSKQLGLPAGAVYVSSEWTKGARGSVSVSGQTVTWTNLAFKPRQKRCVGVSALPHS